MITNSEITNESLNEIVKNFKFEEINNLKLCLIEMKRRGKSLNDNYLKQISKHFKIENPDLLYSVDDENISIDTTSSIQKKGYYLKFKISLILLIIANAIVNISLSENNNEVQSTTRSSIIGGYIGYKILSYFLETNYHKVKNKYNPIIYATGLFVILVIIQIILGITISFIWSKYVSV